jgi:hypothetical protein
MIDARNPKTYFLPAKTLIAKGETDEAGIEINRALALKPDRPEFKKLSEEIRR